MKIPADFRDHPIRAFAVVCVAIIAVYIGYMGYRLNETLSGPGWCRTALGAEKASSTDGTIKGLDACVGLLTIQLKSLATNTHILFGSLALCLLTLIVIVIAKGKLDVDLPKKFGGGGLHLSENGAAPAAQAVAAVAKDKADEITQEAKP